MNIKLERINGKFTAGGSGTVWKSHECGAGGDETLSDIMAEWSVPEKDDGSDDSFEFVYSADGRKISVILANPEGENCWEPHVDGDLKTGDPGLSLYGLLDSDEMYFYEKDSKKVPYLRRHLIKVPVREIKEDHSILIKYYYWNYPQYWTGNGNGGKQTAR